jgi:hypothetical protein
MSRRLLILLALLLAAIMVSGCCCCCGGRRYYSPGAYHVTVVPAPGVATPHPTANPTLLPSTTIVPTVISP